MSKPKLVILENKDNDYSKLFGQLEKKNYSVTLLEVSDKLFANIGIINPDLIILDINCLQEKYSFFFKYFKHRKRRKIFPILFLNSFQLIEEKFKDFEISIIDTLPNIENFEELIFRIERLIKISQDFEVNRQKIFTLEEEVIDEKLERLIAQEKEERLGTILDSVEAFIYIKDSDYQYQYVNKRLQNFFGKASEEIINKDDFEFFDIATASVLRENDSQVISLGKRFAEEEINTGKDGLITTAYLSVKLPMYTENGIIYALCGISTEITERKKAEVELIRTLTLLEDQHKKLQRTQALLVQSEKMASLGTLVAGVAHEVNNPTNYIYISANTLKNDLENFRTDFFGMISESDLETLQYFETKFDKFERSLQNILEGSERIRMIVLDLRAFSRLDEAEKKEINIIDILESTIRIVKTQFQSNIKINTDYKFNENIECYPAQLGQVFLNILLNSYHAILHRKDNVFGEIGIVLQKNSGAIEVKITDNGIGMTDEVKKKIFEPFFTTKSVGQGTGLGMSISYGIIEKHNGRIIIESKVNIGTEITIVLPNSG